MARSKGEIESPRVRIAPALTVEENEAQMIALATNVARRQLEEGTASSQVITHYLKLGTVNAQIERERLIRENELLKAKCEALASATNTEKMYAEAIRAFKSYSPTEENEEQNDEEDDYYDDRRY